MEGEWTPRDQNQKADDLSNLRTSSFDPTKEVKLDLKGQSWPVLPSLLAAGQKFRERAGSGAAEEGRATRREGEKEEGRQAEESGEVVKCVSGRERSIVAV